VLIEFGRGWPQGVIRCISDTPSLFAREFYADDVILHFANAVGPFRGGPWLQQGWVGVFIPEGGHQARAQTFWGAGAQTKKKGTQC